MASPRTCIHEQPFYGSLDFVWDNPGQPVPEETFTHSHLSRSSISLILGAKLNERIPANPQGAMSKMNVGGNDNYQELNLQPPSPLAI